MCFFLLSNAMEAKDLLVFSYPSSLFPLDLGNAQTLQLLVDETHSMIRNVVLSAITRASWSYQCRVVRLILASHVKRTLGDPSHREARIFSSRDHRSSPTYVTRDAYDVRAKVTIGASVL